MSTVKPMTYQDLTRLLREAGFTRSQGKGDHEKWSCPGIDRPGVLTQTREISPAVAARRWARGWEFILDDDHATQVTSLQRAEDQAIREQINRARRAQQEAVAASTEAAKLSRAAVASLRKDRHYSQADSAALLGVSRERIGQLEKPRAQDGTS